MLYILVRISMNSGFGGPTIIDFHPEDGEQLQSAMSHLGATLITQCRSGVYPHIPNPYNSYSTSQSPYLVLSRLEDQGYKVVAANSARDSGNLSCRVQPVWQIWTLHKQT